MKSTPLSATSRWMLVHTAALAASLFASTAQAAPLKRIDYTPPDSAQARQAASGPDFNGDGLPDRFEIRSEIVARGVADRLHDDAAGGDEASPQTCVYVAINDGRHGWSHDRAYCGSWSVTALSLPDRDTPAVALPYVAHLSTELQIPKFGTLDSARDAVFVTANGKPGFLFFDGVDYVLHTGMDVHEVVKLEALEALARFEVPPDAGAVRAAAR